MMDAAGIPTPIVERFEVVLWNVERRGLRDHALSRAPTRRSTLEATHHGENVAIQTADHPAPNRKNEPHWV
jgi:hypothetical protein